MMNSRSSTAVSGKWPLSCRSRSPAASTRFCVVNRNLERMGDAAVNIAERTHSLAGHTDLIARTHIREMGEVAGVMINDAMKAFLEVDVTVAHGVAVRDSVIDEFDQQNFELLTDTMREHSELVEAASHLLIVSRNLERLADEATNIAEEAVFVSDAKIVKHGGWGRPEQQDDDEDGATAASSNGSDG